MQERLSSLTGRTVRYTNTYKANDIKPLLPCAAAAPTPPTLRVHPRAPPSLDATHAPAPPAAPGSQRAVPGAREWLRVVGVGRPRRRLRRPPRPL
eukprot:6108464-Prymnesium_polylepis.1